uniref:Uncharacterized protein n=1 Tax=Globisporangium ultimum (strain ATCC 200006 / CBS 805.95 / DAOM BR144) TaxID=431595 RepID=K3X1D5_GLOUD
MSCDGGTKFEGNLSDVSGTTSMMAIQDDSGASFDAGSPSVVGQSSRISTMWRLYVVSDSGSGPLGVAELTWFSERKKINLTSALSSCVASDGSDMARALDGDKNTVAVLKAGDDT